MKNILKNSIFLSFTILALVSCEKESIESATPVELTGRWNLNSMESNFEAKSESPSNTKLDFSKDNLYIEFKADGTYTSNAEFGIGEIGLNPKGAVSSTYEFQDNRLKLKLIEPSLKIPITLYFNAEKASEDLILSSNIKDLKDAYEDQAGSFDTVSNIIINATINTYVKFDLKLFLSNS
jgi:hypothetical protein